MSDVHPNYFTFNSPHRQYFSLPYDLMNYICQNPLSAVGLLKVQKTCKYFFAKKKIIVVKEKVQFGHNSIIYITGVDRDRFTLPLKDVRIWLNKELYIPIGYSKSLLQNVYRCSLNTLDINKNNLTLKEFDFLLGGGKLSSIWLNNVNIQDNNGNVMTCDKILAKLPQIQTFFYCSKNEYFSSETYRKMNETKFRAKLVRFCLSQFNVLENDDFLLLFQFIQNNAAPESEFIFSFHTNFTEKQKEMFSTLIKNSLFPWLKENKVKVRLELGGYLNSINY